MDTARIEAWLLNEQVQVKFIFSVSRRVRHVFLGDACVQDGKARHSVSIRVQELCESRGGRPGLSVLTSLTVSVDVKQHCTMLRHWSQFVPNTSTDIRGHKALQSLSSLSVYMSVESVSSCY